MKKYRKQSFQSPRDLDRDALLAIRGGGAKASDAWFIKVDRDTTTTQLGGDDSSGSR
jgi:hypothetical protein